MTTPIEAIEILKTLFEKELITSDEYDSRRSQVLDGLAPAPATAQFTLGGISELSVQVEPADFAEVPANFYKIAVPNGGTVKIVTKITALEEPRDRDPLDYLRREAEGRKYEQMRREYERLTARVAQIEARIAEMNDPDFVDSPMTKVERAELEEELQRARDELARLEALRAYWDRT